MALDRTGGGGEEGGFGSFLDKVEDEKLQTYILVDFRLEHDDGDLRHLHKCIYT